MEFRKHLFISYAHLDNEPLTEQEAGWVTRFHASLAALLGMRLGRKAEIWRDSRLQGNDAFSDEIVRQFGETALLVSVVSPRYVQSDWCTREAREFCETAEAKGGVMVDHKPRVFKVIKTPVDSEDALPAVMKQQLGYPFFILDEGQVPVELDPAYGVDFVPQYNLKLAKLAFEMAQLIRRLESAGVSEKGAASGDGRPVAGPDASQQPVVYLAETSYDRRQHREALEAELRLHGYEVLPDRQMSRDEQPYVEAVGQMLARCQLSIHLVGANYGAVPDGPSEQSVVALQSALAIERARLGALQRVLWLPDGTTSDSPLQQAFIESMHRDAELQFGADLVAGDFEALKGVVHGTLRRMQEARASQAAPARDTPGQALIHLICDERDRTATIPLRRFLKGRGLEVQIPVFEGSASTVQQANQDVLTRCEAVILFYGAGDEAWKRTAETDIRKTKAHRERPLDVVYTYLADPPTPDKRDLIELEEPNILRGFGGFDEDTMEPFLRALKERR